MEPEKGPLLVHKDRFQWLDMRLALASATGAFSLFAGLLARIPGYVATFIGVTLAALLFWILTALRGRLKSKWIKEVIDNNHNVFFEMAVGMDQGRALGFWDDSDHHQQMNWVFRSYEHIRRQMAEQLDVILPACSSVSQINEVIQGIDAKSQSYAGLRQIRSGRFAQEFRDKGFGIDV